MLWLIPARAGSKRLPGKNKRLFCGLPLWMWSFATAMRCKQDGDIVLVSTDDEDILSVANSLGGFGSRRPKHLCRDNSTTQSLINWIFKKYPDVDDICLLQPTSPTRRDEDVKMLTLVYPSSDPLRSQLRTTTHGEANGKCYLYRRGMNGWEDVSTSEGHDIDTGGDFWKAERAMERRVT